MSLRISSMYDGAYNSSLRRLSSAEFEYKKNVKQISGGMRINSAADDAAGLYVGTNLNTALMANGVAKNNTQTGLSMLNTADDAIGGMVNTLQKIRNLSLQAANGVYSQSERKMIHDEITAHSQELQQNYMCTKFGDRKLFDDPTAVSGIDLQIGTNAEDSSHVNINMNFSLGDINFDASTPDNALGVVDKVDELINKLCDIRSNIGAQASNLQSVLTIQDTRIDEYTKTKSNIMDADIALAQASLAKSQLLQNVATNVFQQAKGINRNIVLSLLQ